MFSDTKGKVEMRAFFAKKSETDFRSSVRSLRVQHAVAAFRAIQRRRKLVELYKN